MPRNPNAPAEGTGNSENQVQTVQTVKMVRDHELNPEPHEAYVHPEEVDNYGSAGWSVA